MEGIFEKPKRTILSNLLFLISGASIMCFGIVGLVKWKPEGTDERFVLFFFTCLGAVCLITYLMFLLFPYGKGKLTVSENHIYIDAGLLSKLDCSLSEVSGAIASPNGMLTIHLKTGRHVNVLFLKNQWELERYINRTLSKKYRFREKTLTSDLYKELSEKIGTRKKHLTATFIGIGLMFLFLVLCLILVGGKEMTDFTETDWIYFKVFIVLEIVNFTVMMFFANKAGHLANEIIVIRERMSENAISSVNYPPGNVYRVFASEDLSERITVMSLPKSNKVYYVKEYIQPGGEIYDSEDSPIYPSFDDLLTDLDHYIEIPSENITISEEDEKYSL
jgi:hypothetical protein